MKFIFIDSNMKFVLVALLAAVMVSGILGLGLRVGHDAGEFSRDLNFLSIFSELSLYSVRKCPQHVSYFSSVECPALPTFH